VPTDQELARADVNNVLARLDKALTVRQATSLLPDYCRKILDRFLARD
jgi:hypothetical protein